MKAQIIIIAALIVIVVGIGVLLKANEKSGSQNPETVATSLVASETFYDFGTVSMSKGKVKHNFPVKNQNDQKVKINMVHTSCMCTEAMVNYKGSQFGPYGMPGHGSMPKANIVIDPQASFDVIAEFDPNAHGPAGVGVIERQIILETDAGKLTLNIKANVTP